MLIDRAKDSDSSRWNAFVSEHPSGCVYHEYQWCEVFASALGTRPVYLLAKEHGTVVGVLPIIELSSHFFGRIWVSMPYFGHGGMLANSHAAAEALARETARLALRAGVRFVELRQIGEHDIGWEERRGKANMVLELPETFDELWKQLKAKVRSQVRRPEKAGHRVQSGGHELLRPFWLVYSENLRDLGSPCHGERLFGAILERFGARARVFVVFDGEQPIAGGIVVGGQQTLSIPCASSLRSHSKTSPNMMLYGAVLRHACERGYSKFDFGRSTMGEGTYRFKAQWGAKPVPLLYQTWRPPGASAESLSPTGGKMRHAVNVWKRLPVPIARLLGPPIVKGIP